MNKFESWHQDEQNNDLFKNNESLPTPNKEKVTWKDVHNENLRKEAMNSNKKVNDLLANAEYAWNRTTSPQKTTTLSKKTEQNLSDSYEADKILAKTIQKQTHEQFLIKEDTLSAQMAAIEAMDSYLG